MKDITITKHGLRVEGRPIMPGSRLISGADFPAHFARFSVPTSDAGEKVFDVATPAPEKEPEKEVDEELEAARAEYEELFGEKPHHKMKLETIREKINEKLES